MDYLYQLVTSVGVMEPNTSAIVIWTVVIARGTSVGFCVL